MSSNTAWSGRTWSKSCGSCTSAWSLVGILARTPKGEWPSLRNFGGRSWGGLSRRRPSCLEVLSRPYRTQELGDLQLEAIAFAGQGLSRGKNFRRSRTGLASSLVHVDNIGGDLGGTLCGLLDIAGNFLRCAALLLDRGRDRRRNFRNPADRGPNLLDRHNRILGGHLHPGDLAADFIGCAGSLRRERLHLLRNDCEASSGVARTRCLDRGVEGEQIGLRRNRRDQIDHIANPQSGLRQLVDALIGDLCLTYGFTRNPARLLDLSADFVSRGGHLFGRRGYRSDVT